MQPCYIEANMYVGTCMLGNAQEAMNVNVNVSF